MDKMSIKEMYILARCWELEAGEGFIEYFGDNFCGVKEDEIMHWMAQKGYISMEKLELFRIAKHPTVCDCLCGYEEDFSLFPYGECDEDANFKAECIIAEYLFERNEQQLLIDFAFEGKGWATFSDEEDAEEIADKISWKENLKEVIEGWNDEDDDGYERISKLSVAKINEKLEKENEGED